MKFLRLAFLSVAFLPCKAWARLNTSTSTSTSTGPVDVNMYSSDEASALRQLQQLPAGCENFITSGYSIDAPGSVDFYTPSTFITLSQAGTYVGPDAVFEYVGFASPASPWFATDDTLLRVPQFVGYAADPKTNDEAPFCQFTAGFLSKSQLQLPFAEDGNTIIERATFVKFFWDPQAQLVDHIYVLYDDDFLDYFFNELDTVSSAGLVCQVYTQSCRDILAAVEFDSCVAEFAKLPLLQQVSYIDGNSKGCRFLHAVFAGSGLPGAAPLHCPHISFLPLQDPKGFVKCQDDVVRINPTDIFTETDLATWDSFKATVFGFFGGESSLQVVGDAEAGVLCPRGSRLEKGKCKKLCKGGQKLGIDTTISASVPVCIPNN